MQDITRTLRSIGTEAKTAGGPLKNLTDQLKQTERQTNSLGQKLKNFGSRFGGLAANLGGLSTSVVNLSRQYQDLGDAQIKVDRTQLKVSRTTEASKAAFAKLQAAVKKYGANSKEATQAALDYKQAIEAQQLATTMLGEAQEDQQRAFEDFWLGIGPTVASAGGTIISVIKDIIGKKGIGGIAEAASSASIVLGTAGGGKGKGGTGLLGKLGLLGSFLGAGGGAVAGATAGGGTALGLMELLAPIQSKLDTMTGVTQADRTPPLLIPLIGDEKTRKQAIKNYEADLIVIDQATKKTGEPYTGFDVVGDAFRNLFGQPTKLDEIKKKAEAAGMTFGQIGVNIKALKDPTEGLGATIGQLSTKMDTAKTSSDELNASFTGTVSAVTQLNTGMTYFATTTDTVGREAQFLDANFQAVGVAAEDQTTWLDKATKALNAHIIATDDAAAAQAAGAANATKWVETQQQQAKTQEAYKNTLITVANETYHLGVAQTDSIELIELEIQRKIALIAKNYELVKSLDAEIGKLKEAQKQYGYVIKQGAVGPGPPGSMWTMTVNGKKISGPGLSPPRAGGPLQTVTTPSNYFQKLRKKNPSGATPAWRAAHHQHGFGGLVTKPTWMLAGEAGPEQVDIAPLRGGRRRGPSGGWGGFGGGGGGIHIYLDGQRIDAAIRYRIGNNQGIFK